MPAAGSQKIWVVKVSQLADRDIHEIVAYIAEHDDPDTADCILNRFIEAKNNLASFPERGRISPELRRLNVLSYREIQIPPYRMIYEVNDQAGIVDVHIVIDGRRDIVRILNERLLRPAVS